MTCAEGRRLPFFLVPAVRCVVERKVRGPLPIEPVVRGNALAVLLFFGGLFSVFQFWPGGWNAFEAAEVPAGALVGEAFFFRSKRGGLRAGFRCIGRRGWSWRYGEAQRERSFFRFGETCQRRAIEEKPSVCQKRHAQHEAETAPS